MLGSTLKSLLSAPLLPNEPRIDNPALQRALTVRYLLPVLEQLEIFFLTVRTQVDIELESLQPVKLGKPYPLGQCLEIATAVKKRVREIRVKDLEPSAAAGLKALNTFLSAGGDFRLVWGDLRGQYFQNAFQIGTLYVDVSNDTVFTTKPKVEILPFDKSQLTSIRDFEHYSLIASRYWQDEIYPNHLLPALAPYCPLIHISKQGDVNLRDLSGYMIALTRIRKFVPSETILRGPLMPQSVFDRVSRVLRNSPYQLALTPEHGRQSALQHCEQYRAKRWHLTDKPTKRIVSRAMQLSGYLKRHYSPQLQEEKTMNTVKIDNTEYALETLSVEAKAQLQSIQFVDQELARLQAQTAALQTARNAYIIALKEALPQPTDAGKGSA